MSLPRFTIRALGPRLALFAFAFAAIFFFKLWQPQRQIELHQQNLLRAVENKNWSRLEALLSANYHDRFGHDRASAIADTREVMRLFFSATLRPQGTRLELQPATAKITGNLTLDGTGSGATEMVTSRVNQLTDPWIFTWQKESAWPWDWKLVSADNAGLALRTGGDLF